MNESLEVGIGEGGMKTPMRGNHVGNIDRFQRLRTTKKKAAGVTTIEE